mgnify:CR=1 FL=1
MTDKEILDEVYRRLKYSDDPHGYKTNPLRDGVTSFIEREWQKADEENSKSYTATSYSIPESTSVSSNFFLDVGEIEKSQGLYLDESGTVSD